MASEKMTLTYIDEDQETSTSAINIQSGDATLADAQRVALRDALQDCSNASLYQEAVILDQVVSGAPSAVDGEYSIQDKAVFSWKTALGEVVKLSVPAPVVDIFLDDDVIDAGHALVEALKTAALATLSSKAGNLVTVFIGGWRERRQRYRS